MTVKLSICIPTCNRAPLLRELLGSIAAPDCESIHVAISDNASTDDTAAVIEEFRGRFAHFDYRRNETNIGPDRNYMAAADMARGEYAMLLGSDDAFLPYTIARLFEYLADGPDLLFFNRIDCSFGMKPRLVHNWPDPARRDRYLRKMYFADYPEDPIRLHLTGERDVADYFDHCNSIGGVYSLLSTVIFRTEGWRREICPEVLIGSAYPHTAIILAMMRRGCRLTYTNDPLVLWRGGNDSFLTLTGNIKKRILLDFDGYDLLARTMFPDWPLAAAALRRVVVREHTVWYMNRYLLLLTRKLRMTSADWRAINVRMREFGQIDARYRLYDALSPIWLLPAFARRWLLALYIAMKTMSSR